jgi:hypothetical protein
MTRKRLAALAAALMFTVLVAAAQAGPGPKPVRHKEEVVEQGRTFCPSTALVYGNIVVRPGRCYALAVLRNTQGTFLAFADPGTRIPPGQLVRLNTPAGAKLRGRIFYLVPFRTTAVFVPVNAVQLVPVRVDDFGPSVSFTIINTVSPNLTVIFSAQIP